MLFDFRIAVKKIQSFKNLYDYALRKEKKKTQDCNSQKKETSQKE